MSYISRDPFARTELHRKTIRPPMNYGYYGIRQTCDWCGQSRKDGTLFAYTVESDGGRKSDISGQFCSIGCMRSYCA